MTNEIAQNQAASMAWHKDPTRISFFALCVSIVSLLASAVISMILYFSEEVDEKTARSVAEVNRIDSPEFIASLTNVLDGSYKFIEASSSIAESKEDRFERFWRAKNNDADMLLISSRLSSITVCIDDGSCYQETVFSRFPEPVYQALFFLREFIFADPEFDEAEVLEGWWFGARVQDFLADYCAWVVANRGGMNLWSEKHELIRSRDNKLPDPCLPKYQSEMHIAD